MQLGDGPAATIPVDEAIGDAVLALAHDEDGRFHRAAIAPLCFSSFAVHVMCTIVRAQHGDLCPST